MDCAQWLVQTGGYNGFSYADIAEELGIRKATIHYYFRTKAQLSTELLRRYRDRFRAKVSQAMALLDSPQARVTLYLSYYEEALGDGRLCPCGVLAGELAALPVEAREEVRGFFIEQAEWLEDQLAEAREMGQFQASRDTRGVALSVLGMIEGGMLLARASNDPRMLSESVASTLSLVFE